MVRRVRRRRQHLPLARGRASRGGRDASSKSRAYAREVAGSACLRRFAPRSGRAGATRSAAPARRAAGACTARSVAARFFCTSHCAEALGVAERVGAAHQLAAGRVRIVARRRLRFRLGAVRGAGAAEPMLEAVEQTERARVDAARARATARSRRRRRWCRRGPQVERFAAVVAERDAPPLAADEVRLVAPTSSCVVAARPAEVVAARLAEPPEAEHQRADDDGEAADEETACPSRGSPAARARSTPNADAATTPTAKQRQRHQRLGADHGCSLTRLDQLVLDGDAAVLRLGLLDCGLLGGGERAAERGHLLRPACCRRACR